MSTFLLTNSTNLRKSLLLVDNPLCEEFEQLASFSHSIMDDDTTKRNTVVGTPYWLAPEVILGSRPEWSMLPSRTEPYQSSNFEPQLPFHFSLDQEYLVELRRSTRVVATLGNPRIRGAVLGRKLSTDTLALSQSECSRHQVIF